MQKLLAVVLLLVFSQVASAVPLVSYDGAVTVVTSEISAVVPLAVSILGVVLAVFIGLRIFKHFASSAFDDNGHFK